MSKQEIIDYIGTAIIVVITSIILLSALIYGASGFGDWEDAKREKYCMEYSCG